MAMKQITIRQQSGVNKIQFFCTFCNSPHLNHPRDGKCRRCGKEDTESWETNRLR